MFYPIPSLGGKYEISKSGIVRNAETKHILKPKKNKNCYRLYTNGKQFWYCKTKLIAEVFENPETFLPIPSLGGKYEISANGVVRNARTKIKLAPTKQGHELRFTFRIETIATSHCLKNLLWEVWGVSTNFHPPIAITIQKNGENIVFHSFRKCAKFLSTRHSASIGFFKKWFTKRVPEIYGWKVFYHDEKRTLKNLDHGIKGRKIKAEKF